MTPLVCTLNGEPLRRGCTMVNPSAKSAIKRRPLDDILDACLFCGSETIIKLVVWGQLGSIPQRDELEHVNTQWAECAPSECMDPLGGTTRRPRCRLLTWGHIFTPGRLQGAFYTHKAYLTCLCQQRRLETQNES